jgi:hypothetical protein
MNAEEIVNRIIELEQENKQLHIRNEQLQEVIDKIQEIIESNR